MATAAHCYVCGASSSLVCESCNLVYYCTDSHLSLDFARHSVACRKYTTSLETLTDLELLYCNLPHGVYHDQSSTVFPIIPNRKYLRDTAKVYLGTYNICCGSAAPPEYFSATVSVLSALLELNTRPALDKVLVIATDFAYLYRDQRLVAPYFLTVLLKLGRDDLCIKYIHCYLLQNQLRQDYEGNQPLMKADNCCYQLPADRIWSSLAGLTGGAKLEGPSGVILDDFRPYLDDLFWGVKFDITYALLYLRLKADLVSLRTFDSVEGFLEQRLNYDVKEIIKGFIPDTVTVKEMMRKRDWKSVASGRYEGAIATAEEKVKYYFQVAGNRNGQTWKKVGLDWSRESNKGVDIIGAEKWDPTVLVDNYCDRCTYTDLEDCIISCF